MPANTANTMQTPLITITAVVTDSRTNKTIRHELPAVTGYPKRDADIFAQVAELVEALHRTPAIETLFDSAELAELRTRLVLERMGLRPRAPKLQYVLAEQCATHLWESVRAWSNFADRAGRHAFSHTAPENLRHAWADHVALQWPETARLSHVHLECASRAWAALRLGFPNLSDTERAATVLSELGGILGGHSHPEHLPACRPMF